MEISGKIKVIGETIEKGTFKSRNVVVTTEEQYPQHIQAQFVQDKCDVLNGYEVGQNVTIGINLRGREWTNPKGEVVYFNTIQGWKISKSEQVTTMPEIVNEPEVEDDLPF